MRIDVKKEKNKYRLTSDNLDMLVYEDVIIKYRLLHSTLVDEELLKEIKEYSFIVDGYYMARKYLNKPRTINEVKIYLRNQNNYHVKIIEMLLNQRYLDDELYSNMYLNYQKNRNLKGIKLIKNELSLKGVDSEILNNLEYGDEQENIDKLVAKLKKTAKNKSSKALNEYIYHYLKNKGYIDIKFEEVACDELPLIKKEYEKLLKKYQKKFNGYELRSKIFNSLYQKGFKADLINKVIK